MKSVDRTLPKMDSEYSMGYQLTMELLKEDRNFTAIAGQNDMMALGAIDALEESRIRVPKDVSVIGCDDTFLFWHPETFVNNDRSFCCAERQGCL